MGFFSLFVFGPKFGEDITVSESITRENWINKYFENPFIEKIKKIRCLVKFKKNLI